MLNGAGGRFPFSSTDMLEEEPLYVNAKQYHRILKRRQARAKLEASGKIPKTRSVKIIITNTCTICLYTIVVHDVYVRHKVFDQTKCVNV